MNETGDLNLVKVVKKDNTSLELLKQEGGHQYSVVEVKAELKAENVVQANLLDSSSFGTASQVLKTECKNEMFGNERLLFCKLEGFCSVEAIKKEENPKEELSGKLLMQDIKHDYSVSEKAEFCSIKVAKNEDDVKDDIPQAFHKSEDCALLKHTSPKEDVKQASLQQSFNKDQVSSSSWSRKVEPSCKMLIVKEEEHLVTFGQNQKEMKEDSHENKPSVRDPIATSSDSSAKPILSLLCEDGPSLRKGKDEDIKEDFSVLFKKEFASSLHPVKCSKQEYLEDGVFLKTIKPEDTIIKTENVSSFSDQVPHIENSWLKNELPCEKPKLEKEEHFVTFGQNQEEMKENSPENKPSVPDTVVTSSDSSAKPILSLLCEDGLSLRKVKTEDIKEDFKMLLKKEFASSLHSVKCIKQEYSEDGVFLKTIKPEDAVIKTETVYNSSDQVPHIENSCLKDELSCEKRKLDKDKHLVTFDQNQEEMNEYSPENKASVPDPVATSSSDSSAKPILSLKYEDGLSLRKGKTEDIKEDFKMLLKKESASSLHPIKCSDQEYSESGIFLKTIKAEDAVMKTESVFNSCDHVPHIENSCLKNELSCEKPKLEKDADFLVPIHFSANKKPASSFYCKSDVSLYASTELLEKKVKNEAMKKECKVVLERIQEKQLNPIKYLKKEKCLEDTFCYQDIKSEGSSPGSSDRKRLGSTTKDESSSKVIKKDDAERTALEATEKVDRKESSMSAATTSSSDGNLETATYSCKRNRVSRRRQPRVQATTKVSCKLCGKKLSSQKSLAQHQLVHTGYRPFLCGTCGKAFSSGSNLRTHQLIHTGKKAFSCTKCNKRFTLSHHLRLHQGSHTGDGGTQVSCNVCGKTLSPQALASHQRTHTGEKPYSCTTCGKRFTKLTTLVQHQSVHTGEKPFVCKICDKAFTRASHLAEHDNIHTGKNLFSCKICGKSFPRRSGLKRHQATHDQGHGSYRCLICEREFKSSKSVAVHQRRHTGELFSCSACDKSFVLEALLKRHQRMHSGEFIFSCVTCKKKFWNKGQMNQHMRTHVPQKERTCNICKITFVNKRSLMKHNSRHNKPFLCDSCGKAFRWPSELASHQSKHAE